MSRIVTSGDDWMRDMEKRVGRQERRPAPASFADQLGPGITQRARTIADWNDPGTLRNGWYFTDVLSLNTPDPFVAWTGMVTISSDNRGMQHLWSHETIPREYIRTFEFGNSAVPTFTPYRMRFEDTDWIDAVLGNGWTHDASRTVQYRRLNGEVRWQGVAAGGTVGSVMCTVLPGFRPEPRHASVPELHIPVTANSAFGYIAIDATNGQVIHGAGSNAWVDVSALQWIAEA